MKKLTSIALALLLSPLANADTSFGVDLPRLFRDSSILSSTPPINDPKELAFFEDQMKTMSKSTEPIQYLWTIDKMKTQPNCGRFLMVPVQGKVALTPFALGGFICEDGSPPLQACPDKPKQLVAPGTTCKGGKPSIFTKEAQAMYDKALSDGAKRPEDAIRDETHVAK